MGEGGGNGGSGESGGEREKCMPKVYQKCNSTPSESHTSISKSPGLGPGLGLDQTPSQALPEGLAWPI